MTMAHDELSPSPMLNKVQLSDTEVLYLVERLQMQDHMNPEDIPNTIAELENFYTFLKNNNDAMAVPSPMVDKAWHQHILNTKMYNTFSRQHFGIEILHHAPFWTGNIAEVKARLPVDVEVAVLETYKSIVAMLGIENVNKTVWLIDEVELDRLLRPSARHSEL
ncbi:unnamed protein product [Rotaria sp. Silwood1]|nr:unnamed protein product [Rotaria sp. Silwood1]CAF1662535.1 unnamed protein product [Rotaria sp. Silwood1]CAF3858097.1 unnamed protein product [Rotaria sp. Silwood1]CAF4926483.1 unnamed protein product [Rotaria sp. Silwood1]CAF4980045.1 unnamed protein product [Rotaria sp. Silwood1]